MVEVAPTHTKKNRLVFVILIGFGRIFAVNLDSRRFVDLKRIRKVFQSHGDDIGISFSPM